MELIKIGEDHHLDDNIPGFETGAVIDTDVAAKGLAQIDCAAINKARRNEMSKIPFFFFFPLLPLKCLNREEARQEQPTRRTEGG